MKKSSCLASRQRALICSIGIALSLAGISACSSGVNTQAVPSVNNTNNVSLNNLNEVEQKLVGKWDIEVEDGDYGSFIFTSDRKLLMYGFGDKYARELGNYKINADTMPMHLDIVGLEGKSVPAIIELIGNDEMQFQFLNRSGADLQRPKDFDDNFLWSSIKYRSTELPVNVEIQTLEEQLSRAKSSKARNYLGTISRKQNAYMFEKNKFSNNLEELGIFPDTELFDIKLSSVTQYKATAVAVPKENGLRSFVIGMHYDPGSRVFSSKFCRSNQYSQEILPSPKMVGKDFQCPSGTTAFH